MRRACLAFWNKTNSSTNMCQDQSNHLNTVAYRVLPHRTLASDIVKLSRLGMAPGSLQSSVIPPYKPVVSISSQTRQFSKEAATPAYPGGIDLTSIKRFLSKKGVKYEESHPCLCVMVPRYTFGQDISTEWSKLDENLCSVFINKVTGSFVCPEVALTGTWLQLEMLLTAWIHNRNCKKGAPLQSYPEISSVDLKLPDKLFKLWDSGMAIEKLSAIQFKELLNNFKQIKRDFNIEHFSKFGVRVNKDLTVMYFPVKYITGEMIGIRRLMVEDNCLVEDSLPGGSGSSILPFVHNLDAAWTSKTSHCVLVGSVLDSVVLSARTNKTIICLAEWTNLPPDLLAYMDQFKSVTIWLGSGVQGVETAKSHAKKIGESLCRVVTSEWPSALQAVRKRMDVSEILDSARSTHHEYITTFDNLRHDVFLEFLNTTEMEGVKWTRFDHLNTTLRGFRRGEMTVFTGRTGSGKTTFMSEYSLDLCMQGVSTLWGSFEVKNVRLVKMMLRQFGLVNLEEHLEEFDKIAERFSKLPLYFTTFHGTQEVDDVLDAMSHAVYVHDIAHVIIDNIQFMIGSTGNALDRFTRQDQCIEKFRKFATLHNVHVTLVIHPRKDMEDRLTVHSIFGGGKATQEADNVLLLQEEETEGSILKKKSLEVVKNRYAGDLGVMPLFFTKPVLSFSKKICDSFKKTTKKKLDAQKEIKKKKQNVAEGQNVTDE